MEWILIDIQGFKENKNNFILKEICLETKNLQFHDIIKSPARLEKKLDKKHRRQVKWLTKHFHGISWSDGYITLNEMRRTLCSIFNNKNIHIYVKGEEKIDWLKQILQNDTLIYTNVENYEFEVLSEDREKCWPCTKHKHIDESDKIHCALENVKMLKKWFMRQRLYKSGKSVPN